MLAADRDEFAQKLGRSYKAMFYHLENGSTTTCKA